jgi:hypothetical protein
LIFGPIGREKYLIDCKKGKNAESKNKDKKIMKIKIRN